MHLAREGPDPSYVHSAQPATVVRTGLDVLLRDGAARLRGRRAGLISHPAAVTADLTPSVIALRRAGVDLVALFGMEHGFAGAAPDGAAVGHAADRESGLAVYSLYGADLEPTPAMLAGIDVLVYDVQDVGARYYTFISTLFHALRACGRAGIPLLVLDRPNPLGGLAIEGPSIEPGYTSFVGIAPMPIRHGLTPGEMALYLNATYHLMADLQVIAMEGWEREMWFDQTGLPWVPTSPGIPHLSTATVYPGTCLLEGTTLSEGRGTALPFELAGAPWLDPYRLADDLNGLNLPGVRFRPAYFEPATSKHAGRRCAGVQIHVTARDDLQPVTLGMHLVAGCRAQDLTPRPPSLKRKGETGASSQAAKGENGVLSQAGESGGFAFLPSSWEGHLPHFDLLAGGPALRTGLAAGSPVAELTAAWPAVAARFREERAPCLLYE